MLALTDKEKLHAVRLMKLVSQRGLTDLAKSEFDAGITSGAEMARIFEYFREINWIHAEEVIKEDARICALPLLDDSPVKKKREKTQIDAALNRRLRNLFTRTEYNHLGIKDMTYNQALELVEKRERELINNGK